MALVLILAILVGMTWLAAVNPRAALLTAIFLIPWGGLDIDIGLRITAFQLALAPLCLVTLVRASQPGWAPPRLAAGGLFLAMALHAIIWSLLQIGFIPDVTVNDTVLRGPTARAIVQIALYIFNLAPALLVPLILASTGQVRQALRIYIASLVALAIIGWLQIISWYGLGYNPLPIGAVNIALGGAEAGSREGQFLFDTLNIYRMNSLAGEPRNLGTALVLGLLILQSIALASRHVPGRRLGAIWAFLLASTIATFSTSAAFIWLIGTMALLPTLWLTGIRVQRSTRSITIGILAILLPIGFGVAVAEASGIPVLDLVAERTFDRIDSNGAIEDFDLAITAYLQAHPSSAITGVGMGNAHLYATPYLDPEFALYAEGRVFIGKTSVVRITSELGLIGLALFLLWYLSLVVQTRNIVVNDPQLAAAVPIAILALILLMSTNQVASEVWTIAGGLAVLCRVRQPATLRRRAPVHPA